MIGKILQSFISPGPKGWIAYYCLEDWYLSLSEDTRQKIKAYSPHPNEVDKGSHLGTTQSAQRYLLTIGTYATSKDPAFAEVMFKYALMARDDNPIDRHFVYNELITLLYKQRENRADAIDLCIKYCIEDIQRIDAFKTANEARFHDGLPVIPSFDRLRIIYEKQGKYREAIQVCSKAIEVEAWDIESGNDQITKLIKKMKKAES